MGVACCEATVKDPDIDNAQSLDELVNVINKKVEKFEKEKEEIDAFLKDPENNTIKSFNYDEKNTDKSCFKKRTTHLYNLQKALTACYDTINRFKKVSFK